MASGRTRTQPCNREQALTRLRQAQSFVEVAELVVDIDDDIASPGVAAALAVLAGIAASDAACCASLKQRARGQDHLEAVEVLATVHPHGEQMSKDLRRLLSRKDDAHYGLNIVGVGDAERMLEWARRITDRASKVVEGSN